MSDSDREDRNIPNREILKEMGRILVEMGATLAKFAIIAGVLFGAILISIILGYFLSTVTQSVNITIPDILGMVPDMAWTVIELIVNFVGLVFWLWIVWSLWDHARDRVKNRHRDTDTEQ